MSEIQWSIIVPGEEWHAQEDNGATWVLTWHDNPAEYRLAQRGSTRAAAKITDRGLYYASDVASEYIAILSKRSHPKPDHPLARFKSGMSRGSIHKLYFGGRYWTRLNNGPVTIAMTPVNATIGEPGQYHFKFWHWPLPPGFIPNLHGKGYIKCR